ncbi:MAG: VanW family protein [Eubacteriales bacterium]
MKKSSYKKTNTRKAVVITAAVLLVLAAAGAATYFFATMEKTYPVIDASGQKQKMTIAELKTELDVQTIYPGITINGVDMSGKTKAEAAAVFAGDPSLDAPEVNIVLSVDGVDYPLDPAVIKIASNLPAVIDEAFNYNRTSTKTVESEALVERYTNLVQLSKTTKNYVTEYTADTAAVDAAVHVVLDPLVIKAVDAAATSFDKTELAFVISDSSPGLDVDIDTAIKDVKAAIDAKEYVKTIPVATTVVEPTVTKQLLADNLGLVSTTTTVTSNIPNRNVNIDLVCKIIDGFVLQPGESFNYNDVVGQRTAEKGFKEAVGIYEGTTRQELGGGICQVSGTMYHSVLMADLKVDERHPHSWPSAYVDKGTDATVTWDGVNFQFTNNSEYPVAIHAYYNDLRVTVSLYGRPVADGMTIKVIGVVTSETPPGPVEYVADPLTPVGTKPTQLRAPHNRITAECYKVYYKDGVEVKRELASKSTYNAITEKLSIGVLAPDGSICPMDPLTGLVTLPTPVPPVVTPDPAVTPAATVPVI